jgi:hypothetical protein
MLLVTLTSVHSKTTSRKQKATSKPTSRTSKKNSFKSMFAFYTHHSVFILLMRNNPIQTRYLELEKRYQFEFYHMGGVVHRTGMFRLWDSYTQSTKEKPEPTAWLGQQRKNVSFYRVTNSLHPHEVVFTARTRPAPVTFRWTLIAVVTQATFSSSLHSFKLSSMDIHTHYSIQILIMIFTPFPYFCFCIPNSRRFTCI